MGKERESEKVLGEKTFLVTKKKGKAVAVLRL